MHEGIRKLASSCDHFAADMDMYLWHKFVLLDSGVVVNSAGVDTSVGISVGFLGLVVDSSVADIHQVLDGLIWTDDHCAICCDALREFLGDKAFGVSIVCQDVRADVEAGRIRP